MRVVINGRFLKYTHIWFEHISNIQQSKELSTDVCLIYGNNVPTVKGSSCVSKKQYSLITNLEQNIEDIKVSKTVKNEINRSNREGVVVRFFNSNDLLQNEELLETFEEVYHSMYKAKGMDVVLNLNEIKAYVKAGMFFLSVAYINGNPSVFHSYIGGNNKIRLFHSCSEFRINDKETRNAIGRANKYLHWMDLQYFKNEGYLEYDWGGLSDVKQPNGIDQFKMMFNGELIEYYNLIIYISLKAKFLHKIGRI